MFSFPVLSLVSRVCTFSYKCPANLIPRGCDPFGQRRGSRPLATSGQVQLRKSTIHGLPITLRMLRVKSDKSSWFWSRSIVFTKPFKTRMSLDLARGPDFSSAWQNGPLGTRFVPSMSGLHMFLSTCLLVFAWRYFGFSWMSQCQEGVILMKNGFNKLPISHGFEKTTRIQTKCFVLLARRAST